MRNNSLYKDNILTGKKNFNYLFRNGKIIYGRIVNIIYINSESFKIGFAVSKKIRSCVKKNKLKRQLREIYRNNKIEFPNSKNIIIVAKKEVDFLYLRNEVLTIISAID